MRESDIENYLVRSVKDYGGEVRKVKWIGRRGAPDRVVFLYGTHFVELKRPKKTAEAHQTREHKRMAKNGASVRVLDTFEKIDAFMGEILTPSEFPA